ncbi:hypothetical protein ACIPRD_19910 [Streptomyces sp. NPDC090108]|uniref:hypothetical protein n=1 Tax=Streptomyces sp. NPDC090108 TaxID=3365947 RepID=UPI0038151806
MPFFAYDDADHFYGDPHPAPGTRVRFCPERLFAARERRLGRPVRRQRTGSDGLVVHEDPTAILTWPAALWRVEDLEHPVRPVPHADWARCQAFTVVEQVPARLVAGPHGDAVERVITQARALTDDQVEALAALPDGDETALTRELWDQWRRDHGSGSPVGCGLTVLHDSVTQAARRVGPHLFGRDEDDEVEVLDDPSWIQAHHAAHAAALALGAPDHLPPPQNTTLSHRWTSVMGDSAVPGLRRA